jgi:PAS domain S-box-containing protein
MFSLNPYSLGIFLVVAGLILWLLARLLVKAVPRTSRLTVPAYDLHEPQSAHADGMMVVQQGGRILTVNASFRQLFQLSQDDLPNLEWIARRVRPAESFLQICASDGSERLIIEGRFFQVTSYRLNIPANPLIVITFRPAGDGLVNAPADIDLQHLQVIADLNKAVASSLDLDTTIQTIIESVEKLLPVDYLQVCVWDAALGILVPYRYLGLAGAERTLERMMHHYQPGDGLVGRMAQQRQPVLISSFDLGQTNSESVDSSLFSIRSYLGMPLLVGGELVGTIDAGSITPGALKEEDLGLLEKFAEQASVALHNAVLFRSEQRRASELSGLAHLAQAFSSVGEPRSLFARLVQSIVPLVDVEIIGFLLFNETQRRLESQTPYYGIPPQFLELYNLPVPAGSVVEQTLLKHSPLVSNNASEDPEWQQNGFGPLANGASLYETALIPLISGGRMLGYLQASNHIGGIRPFSQDELHLLTIIANQAAPMIENATLAQQMRMRALRAEALRKIASLASSAANLEEILHYSIQELASLLKASVGAAFLLDPGGTVLRLHMPSCYGKLCALPEQSTSLSVDDAQYPFTVTAGQHPVTYNSISFDQPIIPFYQEILHNWNVQSAVIVPLIVRDHGIGELWLGSASQDYFDLGDMQTVSTAAGQLAGVVEQSYLSSQTDESLRRRVEQLTALMQISRELSSSLDLHSLLQLVYDQAILTTRADCGAILLIDWKQDEDVVMQIRHSVGDANNRQLSGPEIAALESGEALSIPFIFETDMDLPHEGVQSILIVPIIYQQKRLGLIELHSARPHQFDDSAIEIAQSLASQAAAALTNAIQYEQQTRRGALLKHEQNLLTKLFRIMYVRLEEGSIEAALQVIADAVRQATPFRSILISVFEPPSGSLRRVVGLGISPEDWEELQRHQQPWSGVLKLLEEQYRVGMSFYIPSDNQPVIPEEVHTLELLHGEQTTTQGGWDADDFLLVPLMDANGSPLGLISLDAPADGRRPDLHTFEALDLIALQASQAILISRQYREVFDRLHAIEETSGRTISELQQLKVQMPLLVERDSQHASAMRRLERQVHQLRAGLEAAVLSSQASSVDGLLATIASEILTRFELDAAVVAERTPAGPRLVHVVGNLPEITRLEALFGQRNPLRQMLDDGQLVLVSDLQQDGAWRESPFLNALSASCLIGIPLVIGSDRRAGVLAIGQQPAAEFEEEDRLIFQQVATQLEVALQNMQLLNETRRRVEELDLLLAFTRTLGGLDAGGVLLTLVQSVLQVIPAAEAAWVALWDGREARLKIQAAAGYPQNESIMGVYFDQLGGEAVSAVLRVLQEGQLAAIDEVHFANDYRLPEAALLKYRRASGGSLPVSVLLAPFSRGDNVRGVLALENYHTAAAFHANEDHNLVLSLSQQAALALENARLFEAVKDRAAQMQSLTRAAGTINASLHSADLLQLLLEQLRTVVPYETATLWMRHDSYLQVAAASGFSDDQNRIGLSVAMEDSRLLQEMIATGQPISVVDVRQDGRFTSLLVPDHLSWLGIPLISKAQVTGVIALEKSEPDFYTTEYVQAAATFASQAAIALENAFLFEESLRRASELDQRSQRLALLNRFSEELGASLDTRHVLRSTLGQARSALDAAYTAIVLPADDGTFYLHEETPDPEAFQPIELPLAKLFEHLSESQGIYSARDITEENELELLHSFFASRQVRSLLSVPLIAGSKVHGWLWISKVETYRFTSSEVELARTISNQAALAVQNAGLFAERQRLTEELERRVEERTIEFRREHQNTQTLLRIITELSASLDLGQVMTRTLGVLNESLGAEQSLILMSNPNALNYQAGTDLIELHENGHSTEKKIANWVMRRRVPALADDLALDARWDFSGKPPRYRSLIAVPLLLGEEVLGTLLLLHQQPSSFIIEQVGLVEATARQISVALNNAELFNLIRDQSENMGSLLRDQQIESSRMRAILEAVADGVLVTDEDMRVTLFNASAQRILNVKAAEIVGQSMEQFAGLFGAAAQSWMKAIRRWSEAPDTFLGDTYAEQINLDNEKIVSIHLAPVIWRSQLLGTVSIFRDITHEVQVDRLKSEFVANVSHELRTPLTSIKGYVEIMLMGASGAITTQQRHFLDIVKANTERLTVLLNDLLDISRIEAGRVALLMQQLNLKDIVDDVASDIRRRSQEENKPMHVVVEIPPQLPPVYGDLDRIRQVLGNLALNGYNYTPAGGVITLSMVDCGSEVQINVSDTGIGISARDRKRIFDRFFRGEDPLVLATSGTGLGLPLAKTLVEMHRGRLWFQSSGITGEGSTFSFTLPVYGKEE